MGASPPETTSRERGKALAGSTAKAAPGPATRAIQVLNGIQVLNLNQVLNPIQVVNQGASLASSMAALVAPTAGSGGAPAGNRAASPVASTVFAGGRYEPGAGIVGSSASGTRVGLMLAGGSAPGLADAGVQGEGQASISGQEANGLPGQIPAGTSIPDQSHRGSAGQQANAAPLPVPMTIPAPDTLPGPGTGDSEAMQAEAPAGVAVLTSVGLAISPAMVATSATQSSAAPARGARLVQSGASAASSIVKTGSSEGHASRSGQQVGRDGGLSASGLLHDPRLKTGAKADADSAGDAQQVGGSDGRGLTGAGPTGGHAHAAATDTQAGPSPAIPATPAIPTTPTLAAPVAGNTSSGDGVDAGVRSGALPEQAAGPISIADTGEADRSAPTSINTARVLHSMQGSEMRVGMHSVEFGSVSINTSVTRGAVAAQISFEHAELGRALAAHLPAMEARLSRESGAEAHVEIRQGSIMDASGGQGRGGSQRQGQGGSNHASALHEGAGAVAAEIHQVLPAPHGAGAGSGRLDVRI